MGVGWPGGPPRLKVGERFISESGVSFGVLSDPLTGDGNPARRQGVERRSHLRPLRGAFGTGEGRLTELATSELKKLFALRKDVVAR